MVFSSRLALGSQWKASKVPVYVGGLLGFALAAVWTVGWKTVKAELGFKKKNCEGRKVGAEGHRGQGLAVFI